VTLDLLAVETSAGLVKAQAALVAAMSRGIPGRGHRAHFRATTGGGRTR